MPDLIIKGKNITKQLEAHFESGSSDRSFLFHVPAERYFDVNLELVKVLVMHHQYKGVYITFNKPYTVIKSLLQHHGISQANIWFIDVSAIHSRASAMEQQQDRSQKCVHLPPTMKITDLIKATNDAIHMVPGNNKFLFLESLTTLSFYFPDEDIVSFAKFLSGVVDDEKIEWVIMQSTPPAKNASTSSFHQKVAPHVHRVVSLVEPQKKGGQQ